MSGSISMYIIRPCVNITGGDWQWGGLKVSDSSSWASYGATVLLFPHSCPGGPMCPQRGGSWDIPDGLHREVTSPELSSSRSYKASYPGKVRDCPAALDLPG